MNRARGYKALVHDTLGRTTTLVEEVSESLADKVLWALECVEPLAEPARVVNRIRRLYARGVYGSIHALNGALAHLGDAWLDTLPLAPAPPPLPLRSDCAGSAPWLEDGLVSALNGAIGDRLHETGNPLGMGMRFRHAERYLVPSQIQAPRVALFVHGVSTSEWSWSLNAEAHHGDPGAHFGALLERDLGYLPVFLRYNTGRHISHNGRRLAALLEGLRCEELVLVGHSMGGLVARSACAYAQRKERSWLKALTHVFSLGSPHQGAPLEKAGNVLGAALRSVDLPSTQVPARVLNARSAGIKDLRYGYLVDEDWQGQDPDALLQNTGTSVPLLPGVTYAFLAATLTKHPQHPLGLLLGDLLVRSASASGPKRAQESFELPSDPIGGVSHFVIQNHPEVYARLRRVLGGADR